MNGDYIIVKEDIKKDENVVMVINDWYDNSIMCDYVLPVAMSAPMNYKIVEESFKDTDNELHTITY